MAGGKGLRCGDEEQDRLRRRGCRHHSVCTSGFVGVGTPDELLIALEKRYRETRHPSDLTLLFAAAPGDSKDRGLNRLAYDGLALQLLL